MVQLGQKYINMYTSMLASHLALLREGHLEAVFHVFSYLWEKHNSWLALHPTYPEMDHDRFKKHKWVEFYGNMKEAISTDIPELRDKDMDLRMHVDSDHAGDKTTLRSSTGFLIFTNTYLIQWMSKKKPMIETSVSMNCLWR